MLIDTQNPDVSRLSVAERLDLIERLWCSLEDETARLPVPDWHRRGLEARHEACLNDGASVSDEEARARVAAALASK